MSPIKNTADTVEHYVIYEQLEFVFHRDIRLDIPVKHELELFIWLLKT